ncbi:MAG: Succinate--CoA ligase (ADP-forming) subunit alpha [Syntrophomonadaceae bacterium]|nr:Succinate--CoA ligase (ADP-forming) subunit alpha [Bacillota bacterium]
MIQVKVKKDAYYDSVFLMQVSQELNEIEGVTEAVVAMGTPHNKELLASRGFLDQALDCASANDLVVVVKGAGKGVFGRVWRRLEELLHPKCEAEETREFQPGSLDGALQGASGVNFALISLPGAYAGVEAKKALARGLHVMVFSDNVSLEEEVELKKYAQEKGLLLLGPDCGTAIIQGYPLGFANEVKRGNVGLVGAAGTGIQEVSTLIDRFGGGISHALGTGGRDLSEEVGGLTMLQGIAALAKDPFTKVLVVISKPPSDSVAKKVVFALEASGKPAVVCFLGRSGGEEGKRVRFAETLEEAAFLAVVLGGGVSEQGKEDALGAKAAEEGKRLKEEQRYLRGLFSGGTLCAEALFLLSKKGITAWSNIHPDSKLKLVDLWKSRKHCLVDLGDDVFTVGRPHPMIDPTLRIERILREAEDPETAVLLLDIVLGYGAHPDPGGVLIPSIAKAKHEVEKRGGYLSVVASVTGTDQDPQVYSLQKEKLEKAGVAILPSNAQAALYAAMVLEKGQKI